MGSCFNVFEDNAMNFQHRSFWANFIYSEETLIVKDSFDYDDYDIEGELLMLRGVNSYESVDNSCAARG